MINLLDKTAVEKMDEFSFIDSIKQKVYRQSSIVKGIGDDGAVFRQTTKDIVTALDTFVEGIHFTRETTTPDQLGYRVLAANLSDLAAMGAWPAFYLVSITIPNKWNEKELYEIYEGMNHLASRYQMDLIGGDTVSGPTFTISVTVIGFVEREKARYRNLAKLGDFVFVTGTLGDSVAGFFILQNPGEYMNKEYFIQRHNQPTPRIEFARALGKIGRIALNDISDGLANEATEIAEASKVNMILEEDKIPKHPALKQFPTHLQTKWPLFGGEDFELIGTVSQQDWDIVKQSAKDFNISLTKIGTVTNEEKSVGQVYLQKHNKLIRLNKDGYIHVRR